MINYSLAALSIPQPLSLVIDLFSNMDSIYTTMKPFWILSKLLGFFPYSISKEFYNCGVMKITKWDILLSFSAVSCMSVVLTSIVTHYFYFASLHVKGIFDYKIWSWLISVCVLNLLGHFAFQIAKRDKIVKFLSILKAGDLQLNALKVKIDHQQQRRVVTCITILAVAFVGFIFLTIVVFSSVLSVSVGHVLIMEFYYFYYLLYETFFCVQFFIPTFLLCTRIKLLRKHIESSRNDLKLKSVAELFHTFCDGIHKINLIFAPHLIFIMPCMMINDILVMYQIFFYLLQYQDHTSDFFLFENGFFIIFHMLLKSLISYIGHKTMAEVELLKLAVAKSFDVTWDDKRFEYLQILAQFNTRNYKLQNVFFVIDWRVVLSVSQHACIFKFN